MEDTCPIRGCLAAECRTQAAEPQSFGAFHSRQNCFRALLGLLSLETLPYQAHDPEMAEPGEPKERRKLLVPPFLVSLLRK